MTDKIVSFEGFCFVCNMPFNEHSEERLNQKLLEHFKGHGSNDCLNHISVALAKLAVQSKEIS